ncbi:hypothetical protein C0J52_04114 [Blattella germanica]|nr:hypothetical protein C0J52_04114 [Blattella germanica]
MLRASLCIDSLLSVYYAHIHSHMSYGLLFWGNHGMASRVFKLQKRAIRTHRELTVDHYLLNIEH